MRVVGMADCCSACILSGFYAVNEHILKDEVIALLKEFKTKPVIYAILSDNPNSTYYNNQSQYKVYNQFLLDQGFISVLVTESDHKGYNVHHYAKINKPAIEEKNAS